MLRSWMIGSFIVFAGLGLVERDATACSVGYPPSGYVQELKTTAYVGQDETSPKVCTVSGSSCGPSPYYRDQKGGLAVTTVTDTAPKDGKDNTWLGDVDTDLRAPASWSLKDAAGNVLEEQTSTGAGALFTRLGATVCVKTATKGKSNPTEVCSPVTVTSIDITAANRTEWNAALRKNCGDDAVDDADDGGCNASGGATSAPVWLAALGLAFAARRRRRK